MSKRSAGYATSDLSWTKCPDGWASHCEGRSGPILHVIPDETYPKMWRIKRSNGSLSDMANLTWARDGALTVALRILNGGAPIVRRVAYTGRRGTVQASKVANRLPGRHVANRGTAA
jgi:hypothetical protein